MKLLLLVLCVPFTLGTDNFHFGQLAYEGTSILNYTCDTSKHPQPTLEYPAVLFEGFNFNNCDSNSTKYERIRANVFHKWNEVETKNKVFKLEWRSMLTFPNISVTFRACCPSGNDWKSLVNGTWSSTPNINQSVFFNEQLQGNEGVWYRLWMYWETKYDVLVAAPENMTVPACGACYNGQCGMTGKCECAPGYSGATCDVLANNFPTQDKPLILFKKVNYEGDSEMFSAGFAAMFAKNKGNAREMNFQSMRVLHNRKVTFYRNDIETNSYANSWSPGANIRDLSKFFLSNTDLTTRTWYNFDTSIDSSFYVRVEGNPVCDGCDSTVASCYTGQCLCKLGQSHVNCTGNY